MASPSFILNVVRWKKVFSICHLAFRLLTSAATLNQIFLITKLFVQFDYVSVEYSEILQMKKCLYMCGIFLREKNIQNRTHIEVIMEKEKYILICLEIYVPTCQNLVTKQTIWLTLYKWVLSIVGCELIPLNIQESTLHHPPCSAQGYLHLVGTQSVLLALFTRVTVCGAQLIKRTTGDQIRPPLSSASTSVPLPSLCIPSSCLFTNWKSSKVYAGKY